MRLLILGSEGFIGRHCVKFFLQKGFDVYGCDLLDHPTTSYHYTRISRLQPSFDVMFTGIKYDACINASGNGSVPVSISHPVNDFEANCGDVIRLLEIIRQKNSDCKYIHISSAAVYGNPQRIPVTEDAGSAPLSPYGFHKLMAESLCKQYHQLYQVPMVVVRPFSIYGPGLKKQLFWDLYTKIKNGDAELLLWGTGKESRDFIFINDVLSAFDIILRNSPMQADVYNLASGNETTIHDAAVLFTANFGPRVSVQFNNLERAGDPTNWQADISKIHALGYHSNYTFAAGIKETAEWLKSIP